MRNLRSPEWIGKKFGILTVVAITNGTYGEKNTSATKWTVRCKCGSGLRDVYPHALFRGTTLSCGCLQAEMARKRFTKHGRYRSREYGIWMAMRERCKNPNCKAYSLYGGRGIRVCERWESSFVDFLADMGPRPSRKHSLDRIDNDGPYAPDNCRWATRITQARNTRRTRLFTINGVTMCMKDWAKSRGVSLGRVRWRLAAGYSIEEAIDPAPRRWSPPERMFTVDGVTKSIRQWAEEHGLTTACLRMRINAGWEPHLALNQPMIPPKEKWKFHR